MYSIHFPCELDQTDMTTWGHFPFQLCLMKPTTIVDEDLGLNSKGITNSYYQYMAEPY